MTLKKCFNSGPEPIIRPAKVSSGSGGRSRFISSLRSRPLKGCARMERPPGQAARRGRMVIGEGRGGLELESGFFLEERDCLGTLCQERIHAFGVEMVARLVLKIRPCRLRAVFHAIPLRHGIARNPHEAARKRRSSADIAVFFGHDDLQTMQPSNRRGGEAARAGTGDQDIAADRFASLITFPFSAALPCVAPKRRDNRHPPPGSCRSRSWTLTRRGRHGSDKLFGLPISAMRDPAREISPSAPRRTASASVIAVANVARRNRVYAHTILRELLGQGLGQHLHRGLRGGIADRSAVETKDAIEADVDDGALWSHAERPGRPA